MRPQRYILTTLISSILLIGCSKIDNPKAVSFLPTVVKADWTTKGAIDNVVGTTGITAFVDTKKWADIKNTATPNLMYDGELSKNEEGNWIISPNIYWSSDPYKTSFFAYSPKATTGDNNNGITLSAKTTPGIPTITYQMPILAPNQPALMLAEPILDQDYEVNNGVVKLELQNVIAAVGFQLEGDARMKVKSIGIRNIIDKGTISMNPNSQWENLSSSTTLYNAELKFDAGKDYITPTETATDVMNENGYLMVIPQNVPQEAKAVLTIDGASAEKIINMPTNAKWEANKQYIYIINLTISGEVSITVGEWNSTDDDIVDDEL